MDDALCGGGDTAEGVTSTAVPLSTSAVSMIKAAIFMGDPRYVAGLSYEVGTCTASGVSLVSLFHSTSEVLSSQNFQLILFVPLLLNTC